MQLRSDLADRSFRDRRVVVDEAAEQALTIGRVALGVQNVLVPKQIEVLAPRRQRLVRTQHQQVEKFSIFVFGVPDTVRRPSVSPRNAGCDGRQIQAVDLLAFLPEHRLRLR